MRTIKNIKDLRSERARLKLELNTAEEILKEDVEWLKNELKPIHLAGKFFGNAMVNKDKGLVNNGVRLAVDTILKNVVLAKAGWITRFIIPFVVKNISSNYIQEKKPELFGMLKNLITKARKKTNHSHNHYDKSTVDEMDY